MIVIGGEEELFDRVQHGAKIICFGSGKLASKLPTIIDNSAIYKAINCFVDRDKSKQETGITIGEINYNVISYEDFFDSCWVPSTVLLICVVNFAEIESIISSVQGWNQNEIFVLKIIKYIKFENSDLQKEIPRNIRLTEKAVIPKIIHYCWFGKKPIPEEYKKWMESWRKYCPDYEIIEWNESNYDIHKNRYMEQAYMEKKWGFVPDYARLDIIYEHGGIYLDTDVELIANLDDMLYQEGFAAFESDNYVALGVGFGAVRHNSVIKAFMEDYEKRSFITASGELDLTPSPQYQTEVLKRKGLVLNGEYQIIENFTIFPAKMLGGMSPCTRRIKLKDYTKAIHHYSGSWLDDITRKETMEFEAMMNNP